MNEAIPVVVFAFRRADLLSRTLAALRANDVPVIYAFSDGPRNAADVADVAEVRRAFHAIDWAETHIVERPKNLGINAAIITGISETMAIRDEIVICEEDIVFMPGTYAYMCAALARYRNEARVMSVGGWTHPRMTPADAQDAPYFTGRFTEWGWATWRRAWDGFQGTSGAELRDRCIARGIDLGKYGRDIADWYAHGTSNESWDYDLNLHMLLRNGLTLLPSHAMTEHIGHDSRSVHQQDRTGWNDRAESPPSPSRIRWPEVRENPASAECWRRAMALPPRPSIVKRVVRRFAKMFNLGTKHGPGA